MRAFLEALPDQAWMKDRHGRYLVVNDSFTRSVARSREELIGHTAAERFDPEVARVFAERDREVFETGDRTVREHWGTGPRNRDRRYETIRTPVRDESGSIVGLVGVSRDVTERYRREEQCRAAEAHYRRLTETSPEGVFVTDLEGRVVEANPALCRILGREAREVEGRHFLDFVAPRSRDAMIRAERARMQDDRETSEIELWLTRPSGEERRIHARSTHIREDGEVAGSHGVVRDVTEHRQREEAERRMVDVLKATPDVVAIRDAEGHLLFTNATDRAWGAWEADHDAWDAVFEAVHPDWAAERVRTIGLPTALEEGTWTGETAILDADGAELPISQVIIAGRDDAGEITHVSTIMRDISAIRAREEALRRRDAILEAVSQTGTEFLRVADWREGADAGLARLGEATGVSRLSVLRLDRQPDDWYATLVLEWTAEGIEPVLGDPLLEDIPAEAAGMSRWIGEFEEGRAVYGPVTELPPQEHALLEEQEIRSVAAVPIEVGERLWGMLVFDDCVAEREWTPTEIEALRAAAGALGAAIQRRETEEELAQREEELRHAQKMEAIGRLAGGVAHDFNNMLTAIQGFASVLREHAEDGGWPSEYLDEILRAAERSATLTRQLLAFSRKQVMRPEVLDLNRVLRDMGGMLRRLLGETVTLDVRTDERVRPVKVDPGQIEQVIMNLCVNARDAMPDGGTLTLETRNVRVNGETVTTHEGALESGDYVLLTVRDSGVGLDPDTRERIFEPFFTTKATGEGTGLGLATVYGIINQSGGGVAVDGKPGEGTSFRIYLPASRAAPVPRPQEPSQPGQQARGTETVVVVEDELAVRRLIQGVLERQGYTVLTAATGLDALERLERFDGSVDLLLTDVVMPGMGGAELAGVLRRGQPELKVCFMSGYTEDEVFRHGVESLGRTFLEKPFTPDELRDRVAAILAAT
jgi:PAS domain S-box-containing protein